MNFMYKSMGAKHINWQLSQNNQYVSYALLSLGAVLKGSSRFNCESQSKSGGPGGRGQSPLKLTLGAKILGAKIVIKALTEYVISWLNFTTEKQILKLMINIIKTTYFLKFPFVYWGGSPFPHLHRSMKAYISTKEETTAT